MSKDKVRQFVNLLSMMLALAINILSNAIPFNGQTQREISDRFQIYFVPAPYVFAIWGVIYLGWIAFTIFQLQASQKQNDRLRRLGYLFALSHVANATWLFFWHYNQFGLSVFVILILLTLLIVSYLRLDVNRTPVKPIEYWSVDVLFSIYLAWVSVATIANISAWLFSVNWNGFGIPAQTWAVIMLAVASLLGLGMALTRRDIGYLSVLVWAFIGIAVKQTSAPLVVLSAWLAAAAMLGFILYRGIYLRAPISSLRFKTKSP